MKTSATALVILIILFAVSPSIHYTAAISPYIGRHTPGFPYNISLEYLAKLPNNTTSSTTYNASHHNLSLTDLSEENKPNSDAELFNVINSIENKVVRETLQSVATKYMEGDHVGAGELQEIIKMLSALGVSPEDLIRAYTAIKSIAENLGYRDVATTANRVVADATAKLLADIYRKSMLQSYDLAKLTDSSFSSLESESLELSEELFPFPSIPKLASLPLSLRPSVSPSPNAFSLNPKLPLLMLSISLAVILGIIFSRILLNALRSLVGPRVSKRFSIYPTEKPVEGGVAYCRAIVNYWKAVDFVEKIYRVEKEDWITHREYLAKVSEKLKDKVQNFSSITAIYELVRYGHEPPEGLDEESDRHLSILMGGKGDKTTS